MDKVVKKEGFEFSFKPSACEECEGECCIGESGYIWVSPVEITTIAEKLNLERDEFINKYLLKIGYRYSIKEDIYGEGFKCVFFDTEKRQCNIYETRPTQCRTFPFWDYFKNKVSEVKKECPGIL